MIHKQNFVALNTPQVFAELVDYSIPESSNKTHDGQVMQQRWVDDLAAHVGRWVCDGEYAWIVRCQTIKNDVGQIVFNHFYLGAFNGVSGELSTGRWGEQVWSSDLLVGEHVGTFTVTDIPELNDMTYLACNFSQPQPVDVGGGVYEGVRLFPGDDTPRSFAECNLTNCEPPPGSTIERCNTTIRQTGLVSGIETVTIDGEEIVMTRHVHRVHGRRMPDGSYEHKKTPEDIEVD